MDPRGQTQRTHTPTIRPSLDYRTPILVLQCLIVAIPSVASGRRPLCRIRCVRNRILTPSTDLHSTSDQAHRTQLVFLDYHGPSGSRWWSLIGRDHHRIRRWHLLYKGLNLFHTKTAHSSGVITTSVLGQLTPGFKHRSLDSVYNEGSVSVQVPAQASLVQNSHLSAPFSC